MDPMQFQVVLSYCQILISRSSSETLDLMITPVSGIIHILDHYFVFAVKYHFYSHAEAHLLARTATLPDEQHSKVSHPIVGRTAATFGHHPVDVLARVLDITGLAMNAILRIYLQPHPVTSFHGNVFINTWDGRGTKQNWSERGFLPYGAAENWRNKCSKNIL